MSTLLLRLAGPMQSWGTQSRFIIRDTGLEPSKSGVIGLLCAALGKPRREQPGDGFPSLARLAELRMGVRVDREGKVEVDYHTAGGSHRAGQAYGVALASGGKGRTVVSRRYYLADADFLVGLESDDRPLLEMLAAALAYPVWPLFLGRKAFVPGVPVRLPDGPPLGPGLRDQPLKEALRTYPWMPRRERWSGRETPGSLRYVLEQDFPEGEVRRDVPLCFEPSRRDFGLRQVTTGFWQIGEDVPVLEED